jgi:molybdopterin converting factor small subunit
MSVKINLHKTHRSYADGLEVVETQGNTVGECLDDLIAQYPELKEKLFDTKGKLRNTIEIYLNMESAYPDELKKKVKPGDEIHLTILLAGG